MRSDRTRERGDIMRILLVAVALLASILLVSLAPAGADAPLFAAWGTAQQGQATATISNATVRMIARPSLSGTAVRVKLENTFGQVPVTIAASQ